MGEVSKKRAIRQGTVDKADFFAVLKDRRWRPLGELLHILKNKVPPEVGVQFYHNKKKRRISDPNDATDLPYDQLVSRGRRQFIRKRLLDSSDHGFIQRRDTGPGDDDIEFRWNEWHCWSCGEAICGNENPDHLCSTCKGVVVVAGLTLIERVRAVVDEFNNEHEAVRKERDNAVLKLRNIDLATRD